VEATAECASATHTDFISNYVAASEANPAGPTAHNEALCFDMSAGAKVGALVFTTDEAIAVAAVGRDVVIPRLGDDA